MGKCDAGKYPLAGKRHSVEYLREIAHLRPRTNLIGAVTRVRNNLAYATHLFFQQRGFLYIHTPIITASDCEGAGQMFQVTTLLPEAH
jgi:asparaginyl-tRNA synthetase